MGNANLYTNSRFLSINPYVRLAMNHTMPPGYVLHERILYDYELVYIQSGSVLITLEGVQYEATPGDLFLFKPRQRHSFRVSDQAPLVQPHIHFDLTYQENSIYVPVSFKLENHMSEEERGLIRDDPRDILDDFPPRIRLRNPQLAEYLVMDIISVYNEASAHGELSLKWRFLYLLECLMDEMGWRGEPILASRSEWAKQIRLYLEHSCDRRLTLDQLSSTFHLDKSYIMRIFRRAYGTSPIRYHLSQRIGRAKHMLLHTSLLPSEIAPLLGFATLQDFSRCFKRITGCSPSRFRTCAGEGDAQQQPSKEDQP